MYNESVFCDNRPAIFKQSGTKCNVTGSGKWISLQKCLKTECGNDAVQNVKPKPPRNNLRVGKKYPWSLKVVCKWYGL